MSGFWKGVVGFIVARPLIAIALAAIVVAVLYFGFTRRETTPVTHRTERVGLTDQQQAQLGSEQYAKTLRQSRSASSRRALRTTKSNGSRSGSRSWRLATSPRSSGR